MTQKATRDREMGSIKLTNLKNDAHMTFIKEVLAEARQCRAIAEHNKTQLERLEEAYEEEMQASLIDTTIPRLTDEVYALADERSRVQTALKSGLRATMGMGEEQATEAAKTLLHLMQKYAIRAKKNVDQQSAQIASFTHDVDEQHLAQLEATGTGALYRRLKELNELVRGKMYERDDAKVGRGTRRMVHARLATDAAFRGLRQAVNCFAYMLDDDSYSQFIGTMNVMIERYKRTHLTTSKN